MSGAYVVSDDKQLWLHFPIEPSDFNAAHAIAAVKGYHIVTLLEEALQWYIRDFIPDSDDIDDPVILIRQMIHKDTLRKNHLIMCKQLAYTWNDTGADTDYAVLERACELAELDVETIIESISKTAETMTTVITDNPYGVQAAEMLIEEELERAGNVLAAKAFMDSAEERGFKKHTINKAKRLRGLISVKKSKGWVWIREEIDMEIDTSVLLPIPDKDEPF